MKWAKGAPFMLLMLWGCTTPAPPLPNGIAVETVRGERPRFERRYTVKINGSVSMSIKAYTFLGRNYYGELNQTSFPSDKWVLFDPESPADKILDREILPTIEQRCKEIIAADKAFMDSKPGSFTDESGTVWQRQAKP